jgi:hypothetical protein
MSPPYDTLNEYYSNIIEESHHSSILNGSSNLIKAYVYPFNRFGPGWATDYEGYGLEGNLYNNQENPDPGEGLGPFGRVPMPIPLFCIAQGRESYSYLYGQHSHASAGYDHTDFRAPQDFVAASPHHPPSTQSEADADWFIQLGSELDHKGNHKNQPGSAQSSTLDFFGNFTYKKSEIPSPIWTASDWDGDGVIDGISWDQNGTCDIGGWNTEVDCLADGGVWTPGPTAGEQWNPDHWDPGEIVDAYNFPWFEFRAYMGGGRDDINEDAFGAHRCFVPRFPGSYQITINGMISYTDMKPQHGQYYGGKYNIGRHECISFTYTGYIVVNPDGGGRYGGVLSNVLSSDGTLPANALRLFDPDMPGAAGAYRGLTGSNFSIGFCPHWLLQLGGGVKVTPTNAYQDSTTTLDASVPWGTSCYGEWNEPSSSTHGGGTDGVSSWPPKFSLYVVNNTGDPVGLQSPGTHNGTGRLFIGESLVARVEVTENLLFLGRYEPFQSKWVPDP